uniref:Small nuclear RNA-activating complex polypeptide 5 n=1 Tax=Xenopus tropicalis TaxID=8364 RepID=F6YBX4_XENTR
MVARDRLDIHIPAPHIEAPGSYRLTSAWSHRKLPSHTLVEELALQSMISTRDEQDLSHPPEAPEESELKVDDETAINQTELQLGYSQEKEEMEEEDEEEDSDN